MPDSVSRTSACVGLFRKSTLADYPVSMAPYLRFRKAAPKSADVGVLLSNGPGKISIAQNRLNPGLVSIATAKMI